MSTVILEIPEEFARSFGKTDEEAARNAKIELALEMYREGRWSTGKAAEFTGMYIGKFMDLLRDREISRPYTKQMLEQDFRHAGCRE
jgi:predicted HTH domain antitoxin